MSWYRENGYGRTSVFELARGMQYSLVVRATPPGEPPEREPKMYHLDSLTGSTLVSTGTPELTGLTTLTCRRFRSLARAQMAASTMNRSAVGCRVVVVDDDGRVVE